MPHELSKGFNDEDSVVIFWENVDIKKCLEATVMDAIGNPRKKQKNLILSFWVRCQRNNPKFLGSGNEW